MRRRTHGITGRLQMTTEVNSMGSLASLRIKEASIRINLNSMRFRKLTDIVVNPVAEITMEVPNSKGLHTLTAKES